MEYICNAANGTGTMGAGVAGAIRKAGGMEVEADAKRICKQLDPQEGSLYVTTGRCPIKA